MRWMVSNIEAPMTNVTKRAIAACAGTIALACAVIQPATAADMPPQYPPQYGGPPPVEEGYGYQEPPRAYRYGPAPQAVYPAPPVYYEHAPPAVVVVPEPYYVPRRRVYVDPGYPGYGAYGYGYRPYIAGGYGYHRGWGHGPRRW
jgi:hypothetical protein